jgi:hypothetical protein
MSDNPYAAQLERIKSNLALIEALFGKHPELFAGAGYTFLNGAPQVRWWSSDTDRGERIELAKKFWNAGWQRNRDSSSIDWRATLFGIEFVLEDMEPNKQERNLGPVMFAETEGT